MNTPKRVAVMQPYFFPYAGYFRLLSAVDHFVILDDVQFPRRGRVHRSEIGNLGSQPNWLTLPIQKCDISTKILDISFRNDAKTIFESRINKLFHNQRSDPRFIELRSLLLDGMENTPINYLISKIKKIAMLLEFDVEFTLSSGYRVNSMVNDYQNRIISIVKQVRGTHYINLSGGVSLYDRKRFETEGIMLRFLQPYSGRFQYLLPALIRFTPDEIRKDIINTTVLAQDT